MLGIGDLHPLLNGTGEFARELRRALLHDAESEFAQSADDRYFGSAVNFCLFLVGLSQRNLARRVDDAGATAFLTLGYAGEPRWRFLIGDLNDDHEARLDWTKRDRNCTTIRGGRNGFDAFAPGDARRDPIRIPDEGPDALDRRRIVKRSSIFISEAKPKGKNRHVWCYRSKP
jgi:hypothetical protein